MKYLKWAIVFFMIFMIIFSITLGSGLGCQYGFVLKACGNEYGLGMHKTNMIGLEIEYRKIYSFEVLDRIIFEGYKGQYRWKGAIK